MKSVQKNSNPNRKKALVLLIVTSIAIASLVIGYIVWAKIITSSDTNDTDIRPVNTPSLESPTTEQKEAGTAAKEDFINKQESNSTDTADITISSNTLNGAYYQIRTIISVIDDAGTCTLTMTSPGRTTVSQSTGTQSMGSYSVCKGFDIPTDMLGTTTSWSTTITYTGSQVSVSASTQKEIRVE